MNLVIIALSLLAITVSVVQFRSLARTQRTLIATQITLIEGWRRLGRTEGDADLDACERLLRSLRRDLRFLRILALEWVWKQRKVSP